MGYVPAAQREAMADQIELFVAQAVGAVAVYFVAREVVGAVRNRLWPKPPSPTPTPKPNPWAPQSLADDQVWAFLDGQDARLKRTLQALPEPHLARCFALARTVATQVTETDRWIEEIRGWPSHQRASMQAQVERRMAERTQALLDLAAAVVAAANPPPLVPAGTDQQP